jgi:hypothetical protein
MISDDLGHVTLTPGIGVSATVQQILMGGTTEGKKSMNQDRIS